MAKKSAMESRLYSITVPFDVRTGENCALRQKDGIRIRPLGLAGVLALNKCTA